MLNQVAVEALYSATYVETYLDSVENLPDDVQRYLSRIREIDVQYRAYLRDVDVQYEQWSNYINCTDNDGVGMAKKTRAMSRIQQSLIAAQELGDEKLQIVTQLQELIDHKTRQLDHDFKNLDYGKDEPILEIKDNRTTSPPLQSPIVPVNGIQQTIATVASPGVVITPVGSIIAATERVTPTTTVNTTTNNERTNKRARRTRTETTSGNTSSGNNIPLEVALSETNINNDVHVPPKPLTNQANASVQKKVTGSGGTGKKKKRKTRGGVQQNSTNQNSRETRDDTPPLEEPIDPDEPTYCLCDQISFGEMILCDNDLCPIEWFHFSCVSLMSKPKGKWFCPNCRGDRPNVMKPKAQFLKELERYNKEKEEKT